MSTFPGAFVPVAPPADGLRLAFVAARCRRNRKAGAAGTAGVLAAVALIASTGGGGDRTLLQQEPLPPSSTSGLGVVTGAGEPSAAPTSTSAPAAESQVDVTSARGTDAVVPAVAGSVRTNGDRTTTTPSGVRAQRTKPISGPMTRGSSILYTNDVTCPARKQQERQRGLCTDVYASSSSTTANSIRFTAEVCNVGTATELLSYETARELDLTVRKSGLAVWRWSLGRHFADSPHDLTVGAQECINWTTEWAQVDSHGVPVKAGSYEVVADFDADEVAASDRHPTYPVTISQQP
jgi:hypothetical protein